MSQKDKFLATEGDGWFTRNEHIFNTKINTYSKVFLDFMEGHNIQPKKILEIGCSNGWELDVLNKHFGAECYGIDPSEKAITDGKHKFPNLHLSRGTADSLPYDDCSFDVVIFGFCLYLCDPQDFFKIACEADRVLKDMGTLSILDFDVPFPYHNIYSHEESIKCHKMSFNNMFLWNPQYSLVDKTTICFGDITDADQRESFSFLVKNAGAAFPKNPKLER